MGPWPATGVDADRDGVGDAALALTLTVGGAPEAESAAPRDGEPEAESAAPRDGEPVKVGGETVAVAAGEGGAPERRGVGERLGLDVEERVALGLTLRLGVAD